MSRDPAPLPDHRKDSSPPSEEATLPPARDDDATLPPRPAGGPPSGTPTVPAPLSPGDQATLPPSSIPGSAAGGQPGVPGYEVLGVLGRGGMGVVYRARHLQLGREVALKMILGGGHAGPEAMRRFFLEAEAVASFSHPGIVQIHEVGQYEGLPYMALELVGGGSLAGRLEGRPLEPREAAGLVAEMARAMNAAHQAGIVHRDLKPGNVLLTEEGRPKITDFGLARRTESSAGAAPPAGGPGRDLTETGAILGTPGYMAPEQAAGQGKRVGPAADVYALGAVLYACLTGRPPFQASTPLDTILQVVGQEPVRPRLLCPRVPFDLETITLRCLEKDPAARYPGALALADDLGRWLRGEPVTARPVGRLERLGKWVRRSPVVAGLAAAVVLVLVGGALVATYFALAAAEQARQAERGRAEAVAARADLEQAHGRLTRSRASLEESNAALRASHDELARSSDRLLTTAARGLLGPLGLRAREKGQDHVPLAAPEADALQALADGRPGPLGPRFVEEAARSPTTALQLRRRAEYALHAATGLDARRRDEVERVLLAQLQGADEPRARELARSLVQLGGISPGAADRAGEVLARAAVHAPTPDDSAELADALSEAAPAMGREAAGRAAAALADGLAGSTAGHLEMARALLALAERLEPDEARRVCTRAAELVVKGLRPGAPASSIGARPRALALLAARVDPAAAAGLCGKVASLLLQAVTRASGARTGFGQDPGMGPVVPELAALARWVDPAEAAEVVGRLTGGLEGPGALSGAADRVRLVRILARRLEPAAAVRLAGPLGEAIAEDAYPPLLATPVQMLAALASRMEPDEAARACGKAVRTLTLVLDKVRDPRLTPAVVRGVEALAPYLDGDAADEASERLADHLSRTTSASAALAECLAALAYRREPGDATRTCARAARALSTAIEKGTTPAAVEVLAGGMTVLAGWLPPEEARQAVPALEASLEKSRDPAALLALARAVAALAEHCDTQERARLGERGLRALVDPLASAAAPAAPALGLSRVGQAVGLLAGLLPAGGRDQASEQAIQALVGALTSADSDADRLVLAEGLKVLAPSAGPDQVPALARTLIATLSQTSSAAARAALAHCLKALLTGRSPCLAGLLTGQPAALSRGTPSRALPAGVLVDLLDEPLCVGPARRAVLDALGEQHGRHFADLWDFTSLAREQKIGLPGREGGATTVAR